MLPALTAFCSSTMPDMLNSISWSPFFLSLSLITRMFFTSRRSLMTLSAMPAESQAYLESPALAKGCTRMTMSLGPLAARGSARQVTRRMIAIFFMGFSVWPV